MLYRYRCLKENKEFYIKHKADEDIKMCPHCNGRVEKLLPETIGISFKGKGFACNDL